MPPPDYRAADRQPASRAAQSQPRPATPIQLVASAARQAGIGRGCIKEQPVSLAGIGRRPVNIRPALYPNGFHHRQAEFLAQPVTISRAFLPMQLQHGGAGSRYQLGQGWPAFHQRSIKPAGAHHRYSLPPDVPCPLLPDGAASGQNAQPYPVSTGKAASLIILGAGEAANLHLNHQSACPGKAGFVSPACSRSSFLLSALRLLSPIWRCVSRARKRVRCVQACQPDQRPPKSPAQGRLAPPPKAAAEQYPQRPERPALFDSYWKHRRRQPPRTKSVIISQMKRLIACMEPPVS